MHIDVMRELQEEIRQLRTERLELLKRIRILSGKPRRVAGYYYGVCDGCGGPLHTDVYEDGSQVDSCEVCNGNE